MKRVVIGFGILVCCAIASVGQVTPAWPSAFSFRESGQLPLLQAGLSQDELTAIKHIALNSADQTCRKTLGKIGDAGLYQKLSLRRITGSKTVVLRGGEDWEDSTDKCFLGQRMNAVMWVVELSAGHPTLLLQSDAIAYRVMESQTKGQFDIISAIDSRSGRFELTWWRFDGQQYEKYRCATERYSTLGSSQGAKKEELQKTATIIEHHCQ